MEWYEKGLCNKGFYIDKYGRKFNCPNCNAIESLIRNIGDYKDMRLFRALSKDEIDYLSCNTKQFKDNIYHYSEGVLKNKTRGYFFNVSLSKGNDYYKDIIDKVFYNIRVTENNISNSVHKLFSYSKSFIVPLFCYTSKNSKNIAIVVRHLPVNSFNVSYSCDIFNYIKNDKGENYECYDSESIIPIKDVLDEGIIDYIKNNISPQNPFQWYKNIPHISKRLYDLENNNIRFSDLDAIRNIRLTSLTLDLSTMDRSILSRYYKKCSYWGIDLKKYGNFKNAKEVISAEAGCFLSNTRDFIINNKETICLLQAIVISILFINMFYVSDKNKNTILRIISELKKSIPIFEYGRLSLIISNIEDNYVEESKVFWNTAYEERVSSNIKTYIKFLNRFCLSEKLVNSIVSQLDLNCNEYNIKFDFLS